MGRPQRTRDASPTPHDGFRHDVLSGLCLPQRAIPARWLYDERGSELFEEITVQPEYYPTRVETAILSAHADEVAELLGAGSAVIEFGSGSSTKTPLLLDAVSPDVYVPIDISETILADSVAALLRRYPAIAIDPIRGDFLHALHLPASTGARPRLGFFPGSTIGNLTPPAAVDLLRSMATALGRGAHLLIGIDRAKDVDTLLAAYDDAAGVTAAFNLNLIDRVRRELDCDMPMGAFRHVARWNGSESRIEMHLEAVRDISFGIDGQAFTMGRGETIHTENSHKYGSRDAHLLMRAGGWTVLREWTDDDESFALLLAEARLDPPAP